jgi:dienelactone hydrolase
VATYIRLGSDADSAPGGVLQVPADGGPAPAVVVTTAIAGVNDYVERVVDRFAAAGYLAFGLDYYARTGGPPDLSSPDRIMAAVAALSDPEVLDDMQGVVTWLRNQPECNGRVASVGFCIGGTYALLASAGVDGLAAAVSFYGMLRYKEATASKPRSPLDAVSEARCPLLGHFGENDHLVPVSDAEELRRVTSSQPAEIYTYPGAGHAFHEGFRPQVHRPVAAATAWERTMMFLKYHLTSEFTAPA